MRLLIILFACVASTSFAKDASVFKGAKSDIAIILSNDSFKSYSDYNITNIRQGELGESMAYFVRLEKPFAADSKSLCFIFQSPGPSKWTATGKKPEACTAGKPCGCD